MNCPCTSYASCNNDQLPIPPLNCCRSCERTIDPLFPAALNARPTQVKKQNPKCIANKKLPNKQNERKKHDCLKPNKISNISNCPENSQTESEEICHPSDCACLECQQKASSLDCCAQEEVKEKKVPKKSCSNTKMANSHSQKNMKNYMHDNPELTETSYNKSSSCKELTSCIESENEVWIFQCPKGFDPKNIMNTELGKLQHDKSKKVDFCTKLFKDKISLACLTPEKAAEYECICDNIKMIRPVGKIIVIENKIPTPAKNDSTPADSCSDTENIGESACPESPMASKKIKKKFNDQRFTIETTVTVENCADRKKKSRKTKHDACDDCIPLNPPEPTASAKKHKRNSSKGDDLSWLDC